MDLYSPAKLKGMSRKSLQESRAEIHAEIAELEGTQNRSSLQELGLRNLRASFENASALLESGHGSAIHGRLSDANNLEYPGKKSGLERRRESDQYSTLTGSDGQVAYHVAPGQRVVDVPGHKPAGDINVIGEVIRGALTSDYSGLSPEARAVLDESNGTSYVMPQHLSSQIIDLARAQSVLANAGMSTIVLTGDNLKIPRVLADPLFSVKIKNDQFVEDESMQLGAVNISPKMVGTMIRVAIEDLEDAAGFSEMITAEITKAFAASIDAYGLSGETGTQSPQGIFSFADIANTNVAAGNLGWFSLSAAALAIKNRNHIPSVALMTPTREHALLETLDNENRWLGPPPSLANMRYLSSTQCPAANFMLGDFSKFALGLRTGLRIDFSDTAAGAFERNQRVFRVYWRGNFSLLNEFAFQKITVT
jgi:HK97 family phage major capsid protein